MWNDTSFSWLRRLKEVVYAVDDVVDELQLNAEKCEAAADGGIVSKYMCTKPKSFILQCKAASKVKKIKRRFAAIVKQRTDYIAITNSMLEDPPVGHRSKRNGEMPTWPDVDVASVVGRDEDKEHIISRLEETDDQQKIKIISIVGLGGSGKTTLAKLVFNDGNIQNYFDVTLWVHVSQEFDVEKLVKKIFEAFAEQNQGKQGMAYMRNKISENLKEKRFLLVLDDVWTESRNEWDNFRNFYINIGAQGSRILLTTRSSDVAQTVGSTDPFMLPFLSEASSWQLFIENFRTAANGFDPEFLNVGREIVNKCGGMPLAIKAIAGVLCVKKRIEDWQAMRDSNLLKVEDKEHLVAACLRLSYFNMPSHLRKCFPICSVFPKGHLIGKEQLIDLWIAHDMVPLEDDVSCMEHNGSDWFDSLVHKSFLQDVDQEGSDGRVTCRMHDLVHDFARSILGDEISLNGNEETHSDKVYRYFSLTKQSTQLPPKNVYDKARVIYAASGDYFTFDKALKKAKHLRSITVRCVHTTGAVSTIAQIENLRHLHISGLTCEKLPDAISNIWRLEALHVTDSGLLELPQSIGKLQKLRKLNLSRCTELKTLPDSIGDCHMISSIDLSSCHKLTSLPDSISGNKNLRILRIRRANITRLTPSITTLGNLECLDLQNSRCLLELPEGIENLRNLNVLNIEGCLGLRSIPNRIHQLVTLEKLGLFVLGGEGETCAQLSDLANFRKIGADLTVVIRIEHVTEHDVAHKACLKHKTNLRRLHLYFRSNRADDETVVEVLNGLEPPSEIEWLETSGYQGRRYAEWMKKQVRAEVHGFSRFPCLTNMTLSDLPNLEHLEGLVELPSLKHLELGRMPVLESISGGPFRSLVSLKMYDLPRLGEVWLVPAETTFAFMEDQHGGYNSHTSNLRQVQIGSCLSKLNICWCPALVVKPHLPLSLEELVSRESNEQLLRLPSQGEGSISDNSFSRMIRIHVALPLLQHMPSSSSTARFGSQYSLELLQHMPSLEYLRISQCHGLIIRLPESIQVLRSLQSLKLEDCHGLTTLPEWLGELRSLKELSIEGHSGITILPESMQHLTSLRSLVLFGSAFLQLLEWLGKLQSLKYLKASGCRDRLPRSLGQLTSLEELDIGGHWWSRPPGPLDVCVCDGPCQLLESLANLRSLRILRIGSNLRCLTCLAQSMEHLPSLESLTLCGLPLQQLPESLGRLCSLRKLDLLGLDGLISLPQSMCDLASLEELHLTNCPNIKSLPEGIQGLTALQDLRISGCDDLGRRCKEEDWHLISHVSSVYIYINGVVWRSH